MENSSKNTADSFKTLSVVFILFNEEEVLPILIKRTRAALGTLINQGILSDYELIFVNDASKDNSLKVLLSEAQGHKDIRILNMSRRFGMVPSQMAGFAYARGDMVAYMDADLQDPPELLSKLIGVMQQKKVDVVHTVRESRKGETVFKLWITAFGYWLLNKASSINLPKECGDFKLMSRRMVKHILNMREHRPFIRGLICWVGFKQEFVTYVREPRLAGKTKCFVLGPVVISNFLDSALISFSSAPLRVAYFFGFVAFFVNICLVVHVFYEKFAGRALPGWTALMMVILFFNAVELFCMGILGLYVHSIYEETKQRPHYIVESSFGFSEEELKPTI